MRQAVDGEAEVREGKRRLSAASPSRDPEPAVKVLSALQKGEDGAKPTVGVVGNLPQVVWPVLQVQQAAKRGLNA